MDSGPESSPRTRRRSAKGGVRAVERVRSGTELGHCSGSATTWLVEACAEDAAVFYRRLQQSVDWETPMTIAASPRLTLFTNIDGVLHYPAVVLDRRSLEVQMEAPGHVLFEWAEPLIRVCAEFDVEIVLRTSWTARLSVQRMLSLLPAELTVRVVGAIFPIVVAPLDPRQVVSRYHVIREHVECNDLVSWIAVDDNNDGWPSAAQHHLVLCGLEFGLSLRQTELELRNKLRSFSDATRACHATSAFCGL
ncbi:Uncharacterised protein [Burkholderia pseudomallei]|nr:Uncharacterised protein [Burkholderia pseudomallei]CAJ5071750.1 Uncharacterised protein [Burkholderia pseudomallei]CAJ5222268.1 Uncharacterised protein [Burkholderia pseudomallei]CAJ5697344.1 Uncharacterised protein [Burkholderia pseudomallei]CAJ6067606.1 Uncharacterised protein [Burkholderia pseudomallei]